METENRNKQREPLLASWSNAARFCSQ
jgi:hypothetical protein